MNEKTLNIVLIDDDEVDVMNVRRALHGGDIRSPLWVAADGLAGLALLRSSTLPRERRLVIVDISMPRMNGIEFLRELRQDPCLRTTPVLVLTSSDNPRDMAEAYQLDISGYLIKPATFQKLVELMVTLTRYWTLVEMPRAFPEAA
jgi:CheY-like chemotaxis protein